MSEAVTSGNRPQLLDQACRHAGYPAGARLIRHFANAVYLLAGAPIVARVGYGADAATRAGTASTVTRWLIERGFPATAPADLPSGANQPLVIGPATAPAVVTFWRYYPQPTDKGWPDTAVLGNIAGALHHLPDRPSGLSEYQPLRTLGATVRDPAARQALTAEEHAWLLRRIDDLREEYRHLSFPLGRGPIHADLYTGNLLWNTGHRTPVVLGDWDSVCLGPREIDLIPTYAEPRFGIDPATVDTFAHTYGHDLRDWAGYHTLYDIRELSTLTALIRLSPSKPTLRRELAHRLCTLIHRDRTTAWHGQ